MTSWLGSSPILCLASAQKTSSLFEDLKRRMEDGVIIFRDCCRICKLTLKSMYMYW